MIRVSEFSGVWDVTDVRGGGGGGGGDKYFLLVINELNLNISFLLTEPSG